MPIRNPFARRVGNDENVRPELLSAQDASHPGFERQDTVGSKASSALSIRSAKSQDNGDYKMSVVNDSGVYLPPSPSEEKGLWPRRPAVPSRTSMDTRSSIGDIEHFSISRESFDSYRRSFDITARAPVLHELPARQSLDSARFPRFPRTSVRDPSFDRAPPTAEEGFEDVGLHDETKQPAQQPPKKRGLFARFGDSQEPSAHNQGMSRFIPGRKRAQSGGQGAELGTMERPKSSLSDEGEEMQ
ncbi:hypothetical protein JX265_005466 [Neoarthrinium moseri]|uniref:Uncharacterized protein n=1 Tax=Neoarthrinium moseri TaxID=1658444 RepID=A0A9Q0AQ59_9PEZI|nr:uncharacterized protein JN550_009315 [Neoarthrinium moseri]KAI1845309.1 hypothetical protein JX266_008619 [Neoarthrinium moseri]KAI1863817.1 hypothetical protein JN550_009315 [Neoarthrinium moseri]KAI1872586.1 hypothetical protein JX265_005466 [Neoarthrinium moseri]